MQLEEAIRQSYIVHDLPEPHVRAIIAMTERREVDGGTMLVRQYDKSQDLLFIAEGAARIRTFTGDQIAEVGPGGTVGEIALLDSAPRTATVISVGKTVYGVLPAQKLRELMDSQFFIELVILRNLTKVLCNHIRMTNVYLESLTEKR